MLAARLSDPAAGLDATFLPEAGMLCSSLRHRGVELLAQRQGVEAYAREGKTMAIPLLYPWANRLAAFEYSVGGRAVAVPHDAHLVALDGNGLPIHGVIAARLRWQLDGVGAAGAGELRARADWSEQQQPELFALFPFRHELEYRARLRERRLLIEVEVLATGEDAVPVAFGFHPYLAAPGEERARWLVELPAMRTLELDAQQIPLAPGAAVAAERFALAQRTFDDGFDSLSMPSRFAVSGGGRRLVAEFLEGYPYAQVYAPAGGEFICFEPMTAPANALRSGVGLRLLQPGERHRAAFSVEVTDASPAS